MIHAKGGWGWRQAAVCMAAVLVIAGAGCKKTAASKPVLPEAPREAFARQWAERQVFLVGIGDSVPDGYGASPGRGYFDLVARGAKDDGEDMKGINLSAVVPKLKVHNLSMSYSTSSQHLDYQVTPMATFPADAFGIVVMTTGGNDVIHNYGKTPPGDGAMYGATLDEARPWIAALEGRIETMVIETEKRFPGGCMIFLANIYDPTDGVGDIENCGLPLPRWRDGRAILEAANEGIARVAGKHKGTVRMVNIRDTFLGHGIHADDSGNRYYHKDDPSYWYFENLEDPNDIGYEAIRRLFLAEMGAAFGKDGIPPAGRD